ncbi:MULTISPECIES: GGDEF domain-containing response regulator [Calditerrivibrio]|uniref:GGDEF domain-containing response regulator n=1 Tax=Calditerrivibrio TaxID=545865 RepID=UPI003C71A700
MKVLLIDDDPVTKEIIFSYLETLGNDLCYAKSAEEGLDLLSEEKYDIVICDFILPSMNGIELCKEIRRREEGSLDYTYFIMITHKLSKEVFNNSLSCGADDFIFKPFDENEFISRFRAGVRIIELIKRLKSAKQEIEEISRTDYLTGIYNRRALMEILSAELFRSIREKTELCVAILDLDNFKNVNDVYGHFVGDEVLKGFVEIAKSCIRRYDVIGRFGGEEFIIILPKTTKETGYMVMERIRSTLEDKGIKTSSGTINITVSIGVACTCDSKNVDQLIHDADISLYKAKTSGRNRVEVFNDNQNCR